MGKTRSELKKKASDFGEDEGQFFVSADEAKVLAQLTKATSRDEQTSQRMT